MNLKGLNSLTGLKKLLKPVKLVKPWLKRLVLNHHLNLNLKDAAPPPPASRMLITESQDAESMGKKLLNMTLITMIIY